MLKTVIVYCNSENQHGPSEIARAVRQIGKFVSRSFALLLIFYFLSYSLLIRLMQTFREMIL